LAWSCHDYAEALLQSSSTSDLAKALSLLEESLAIATDLGMRPLMERVVAMQERVHTQPAKAPAYPDGLTEREVEVLRLVASGKSNAEIAAELVLSIRTVERHISNIYAKINAHGRVDATSYAFTHGLISST
jgi:DNA-binding NarL/FixJ family response regulator